MKPHHFLFKLYFESSCDSDSSFELPLWVLIQYSALLAVQLSCIILNQTRLLTATLVSVQSVYLPYLSI